MLAMLHTRLPCPLNLVTLIDKKSCINATVHNCFELCCNPSHDCCVYVLCVYVLCPLPQSQAAVPPPPLSDLKDYCLKLQGVGVGVHVCVGVLVWT